MAQTWFYECEGKPHGPFSGEEIKALVATGLLGERELIWPEGQDASSAVPAGTIGQDSSSSRQAPASAGVPDWLSDVASLEAAQSHAEPSPPPPEDANETHENPAWLEDLRIWVGLEIHAAGSIGAGTESAAPAGTVPIAKPARKGGKKKSPSSDTSIPIAMPVPAAPAEPEPVPAGEIEYPVRMIDELARQTLAETGFDFSTGQIVNAVRFKKWKAQRTKTAASADSDLTNASLFERFREARTAIEKWVEDDKNRRRILQSPVDNIKALRAIQDIYARYAGLGFRQKLENYLVFLLANRKKVLEREQQAGSMYNY